MNMNLFRLPLQSFRAWAPQHYLPTIALYVGALVLAVGCASTKVSDREQLVIGPMPRPAHILVYDFVATPADMPPDSALAGEPDVDPTPPSPEQTAEGRKLGAQIATELV